MGDELKYGYPEMLESSESEIAGVFYGFLVACDVPSSFSSYLIEMYKRHKLPGRYFTFKVPGVVFCQYHYMITILGEVVV